MFSMPKLFPRHGCLHHTVSMDNAHCATTMSKDVCDIFDRFSSNGLMHASHFCRFLIEVQLEADVSEVKASDIMKSHLNSTSDPYFTRDLFLCYLFNTKLNFAINTQIHHDMNLPLSRYYIFTGHNSYLTGNQLNSECSEKPIAKALQKGVRVVELDLWPGEGRICVKHGRVWTQPVEFEKCIAAIKENAFQKSQYPVVVTLEDHLSVDLQAKAAKAITDTFGDQLYYPPPGEELKQFPSPEQLKNRILISTKPPKEYLQCSDQENSVEGANAESSTSQGSEISDQSSDEEVCSIVSMTSLNQTSISDMPCEVNSQFGKKKYSNGSLIQSQDDVNEEGCLGANRPPEQWSGTSVFQDYKSIIAIRQGRKGKNLLDALKVGENAKRISLSEPQVSKVKETNPAAAIQFTQNNILRIYPKGWRVDSSNYNPFKAWPLGAQMVALNMQGYGKHLWICQGFFRANGGCGYVKKPDFLLSGDSYPYLDLFSSKSTALEVKQILKVKVCMGYGWLEQLGEKSFDKASPPDFFTRVGIAGVRSDKVMKETVVMKDKWVPIWDQEFQFMLRVPEIAVLRIEVQEDNKTRRLFAGQICLPVSELKSGYRMVSLCDAKGNEWEHVKLLLYLSSSPGNW